jgi:hypothetical protein
VEVFDSTAGAVHYPILGGLRWSYTDRILFLARIAPSERTMHFDGVDDHYLEADVRRNEGKMGGFASWEIFGTGFEIRIFSLRGFLAMNRAQNLDLPVVSRNF